MSDLSTSRPRVFRLQFSLRLLLLALTAFGIGFPIWYRWPYEVEEVLPSSIFVFGAGPAESKRISTWQRQWGGGELQEGPERTFLNGRVTSLTTYRSGRKHGPYAGYAISAKTNTFTLSVSSEPTTIGQYSDDMKEGRWTEESGGIRTITNWHRDLLDGDTEFIAGHGKTIVATFAAGRLVKYNGKPVDDPSFDVLKTRNLDERVAGELSKVTNVNFVETPLEDVVMYMSELHRLPMTLDLKSGLDADQPLTATLSGLDLQSVLVLLTAPHGLAYDYRYGALCITKAETVKDWLDPTGVADVKPPGGSALARAWNEPVKVDFVETPLTDAMAYLEQKMAISIDASRTQTAGDGNPISVTVTMHDLPLRHVLGYVLYNCGCRCELEDDKLVILPPEKTVESSIKSRVPATSSSSPR